MSTLPNGYMYEFPGFVWGGGRTIPLALGLTNEAGKEGKAQKPKLAWAGNGVWAGRKVFLSITIVDNGPSDGAVVDKTVKPATPSTVAVPAQRTQPAATTQTVTGMPALHPRLQRRYDIEKPHDPIGLHSDELCPCMPCRIARMESDDAGYDWKAYKAAWQAHSARMEADRVTTTPTPASAVGTPTDPYEARFTKIESTLGNIASFLQKLADA